MQVARRDAVRGAVDRSHRIDQTVLLERRAGSAAGRYRRYGAYPLFAAVVRLERYRDGSEAAQRAIVNRPAAPRNLRIPQKCEQGSDSRESDTVHGRVQSQAS